MRIKNWYTYITILYPYNHSVPTQPLCFSLSAHMRYSTLYKISLVLDDFIQLHANVSGKVGWAKLWCSGRLGVLNAFSIYDIFISQYNLLGYSLLELTPKKDVLFIIGDWNAKVGRNTWSNRQIWPWNTEWSRAKTNRVLPRKCTGHNKHPLPTTQEKILHMDITRWSTPTSDWLYSLQPKMEKLYTVSKNKTRSWLWLRLWTPDCQIQT